MADDEAQNMVGREEEMAQIRGFMRKCQGGGAMYVCGVSGTGKSEAVRQIFDGMHKQNSGDDDVRMCWLTGSRTGFSLAKALGVKQKDLAGALVSSTKKNAMKYVVVVDEMDLLPREEFRRLFAWAAAPHSRLTLVGIANTVNVSALLLQKTSRAPPPSQCIEVAFVPYDAKQLVAILRRNLRADLLARFRPEALELCARKAALRSGDLRHAMSLCEQVGDHVTSSSMITVGDVGKALGSNSNTSVEAQIEALPAQTRFALVALAKASRKADGTSSSSRSVVAMSAVQLEWARLKDDYDVPVEGSLPQYLDDLVDLGLVGQVAAAGRAATQQCYQLQVAQDDVLRGLVGGGRDSSGQQAAAAMQRPIVLAFRSVKRPRLMANMHAVAE